MSVVTVFIEYDFFSWCVDDFTFLYILSLFYFY